MHKYNFFQGLLVGLIFASPLLIEIAKGLL
jgi:hypothetical protein